MYSNFHNIRTYLGSAKSGPDCHAPPDLIMLYISTEARGPLALLPPATTMMSVRIEKFSEFLGKRNSNAESGRGVDSCDSAEEGEGADSHSQSRSAASPY